MLAVKPLRKSSRLTDVSERVQAYWFSKSNDHDLGRRSQKAMWILLAEA